MDKLNDADKYMSESEFESRFAENFNRASGELYPKCGQLTNIDETAGLLAAYSLQNPGMENLGGIIEAHLKSLGEDDVKIFLLEKKFLIPVLRKVPAMMLLSTGHILQDDTPELKADFEKLDPLIERYMRIFHFRQTYEFFTMPPELKKRFDEEADAALDTILNMIAEMCVLHGYDGSRIPPYEDSHNFIAYHSQIAAQIALALKIAERITPPQHREIGHMDLLKKARGEVSAEVDEALDGQ